MSDVYRDRRKWPRFKVQNPVTFRQDGALFNGTLWDLSRGGAFLKASSLPYFGEKVELTLPSLADDSVAVHAAGRVVRTVAGSDLAPEEWGFGVQWVFLRSDHGPDAVEDMFEGLEKRGPVGIDA